MSRFFPTPAECGHHTIFDNVSIRTYAGDRTQISIVDFPADGIVEWHQHPNEQLGIMISGRATFHIGDEVKVLQAGDLYLMPANVPHKIVPIDGPVKAVDLFYPIRDEYR